MDDNYQHEKELCGELVPRLFEDDVWKDIDRLDLEDTMLVYRQAKDVIHNNLFADLYNDTTCRKDVFEAAAARLGAEVGRKFMAMPQIYTLIDNTTMLPALDQRGGVFLFSQRAYADRALDYHMQRMRIWQVRKIEHTDIRLFLGNEFYDNGARYAVINDGHDWSINFPGDFIAKPQYADGEAPVSNPDYIRALTMLQQELHWRAKYDDKEKNLRSCEDEMIRTFAGARFLVPFKSDAQASGDTFELVPGNNISFPSVSGSDGRTALPIFSDWDQFAMAYDLDEWQGWVVPAQELPDLPAETVVLNISTLAFAMNKSFLGKLLTLGRNEAAPEGNGDAASGNGADRGGAPLSQQDYQGYVVPLKGATLRERIEEMMSLAGEMMGRPADISGLQKLYASERVQMHPAGERFLKRYAYLFSTMSPAFEDEDDNPEFYFDTFDELREDAGLNGLTMASGRDWRATGAAGCPVTPVGIYGFREPYTVYAAEDGKLYAFKGFNDEVRVYEDLADLLEEALQGHMPVGLDD